MIKRISLNLYYMKSTFRYYDNVALEIFLLQIGFKSSRRCMSKWKRKQHKSVIHNHILYLSNMGVDIIIMRQQNFRIILSEEMIYQLNNITVDPSHTPVAILDRIMTYLSSSRFGSCRFRDQSCGVQVQFYFYCFFYFVLFCSKSRVRSFSQLQSSQSYVFCQSIRQKQIPLQPILNL